MEERERTRTGIKTLKIGYNKVFGYYIEVRHSGRDQVPEGYIRKQTLANTERFITEELKDFEAKILGAQEKITALEYHIFTELREQVRAQLVPIQNVARAIARVDVLQSLAEAAAAYRYVRPKVTADGTILIRDGRHPLVERLLQREVFVPNDTDLSHGGTETMLITGPNTGGKTVSLKTIGLFALMVQSGCYIPAAAGSEISVYTNVYTVIGDEQSIEQSLSTFSAHMSHLVKLLECVEGTDLLLLDEIGAGTDPEEGAALAMAILEQFLARGASTIVTTHYSELKTFAFTREGIENACVEFDVETLRPTYRLLTPLLSPAASAFRRPQSCVHSNSSRPIMHNSRRS